MAVSSPPPIGTSSQNQEGLVEISSEKVEYATGNLLGQGNFGAVYKARWKGSKVALKKIKGTRMTKKQIDGFLQEAATFRYSNVN